MDVALILIALTLLFLAQALGLTDTLIDPETHAHFSGPHPLAIFAGYFLLIFAVANWPVR
jgi:hypothetical protein